MVDLHKTDVLVLAGGLGQRLKTVVRDPPKPLAEIHGRPFSTISSINLRPPGADASCCAPATAQARWSKSFAVAHINLNFTFRPRRRR